jgi:hypothetical protein
MATPSGRYCGACKVISNGPVKTDTGTENAIGAVWLPYHADVDGFDAWR